MKENGRLSNQPRGHTGKAQSQTVSDATFGRLAVRTKRRCRGKLAVALLTAVFPQVVFEGLKQVDPLRRGIGGSKCILFRIMIGGTEN